ncbi:ATP-binding cassette sub-family C member 9-like isoform X2 [Ptychodera flava]|uniref:ATP-binding cassette sub-family C member 9-like isoform X2 n=1 Tax=Ptychodera flava TaxID=63121 RepID=UPI00396A45CF
MASGPTHNHILSTEELYVCKQDGNATDCLSCDRTFDAVCSGIHISFSLLFSLVLLMLGCCTQLKHYSLKILVPYRGHNFKWIVTALLSFTLLCAVGEGVLTDLSVNSKTRPLMYVPQAAALLCSVISLVYYHHMEYWNRPKLAWLSLLYWTCAVSIEVVRLLNFVEEVRFDFTILKLNVIIICISIYTLLVLFDLYILWTKVFRYSNDKKEYTADFKKTNMFYLYNFNSLLSKSMFSTLNWLFVLGHKRPLEVTDLGCLPEDFSCKKIYRKFEDAYEAEKERANKLHKTPSLWRVYLKAYGSIIFISVFIKIVADTFMFIPPLAVGGIVSYATKIYYNEEHATAKECHMTVQEFFSNGFVLIVVMFLAVVIRGILVQYGGHMLDWVTIYSRTAIQAATYEKSLRLSTWMSSNGGMTTGQITNHMSVDAMALHWLSQSHLWLWAVPYQVFGLLALLYVKMGVSALIGSSLLIITFPVQLKLTNTISRLQDTLLKISDSRLKKIKELLQGMKLLKLYGWEEMFCSAIEVVREKQMKSTMKVGASMIAMRVTSDTSYFMIYHLSRSRCPNGGLYDEYTCFATTSTSSSRPNQNYTTSDNAGENYGTFTSDTSLNDSLDNRVPEHIALKITDGIFSWDHDGTVPTLRDINCEIHVGSLVMIIGLVGSGKSSLLSAILGEMSTIHGSVQFTREKSRVSYVPQKAWLQNATLRDNILFGQEFDLKRYNAVIEACALQPDIDILPAGDMTEIGERGINLSGGQKHRVSVARAIYSKTDVVMLDDPLAALDVHVGSHVLEKGIMDMLVREGRTVILVTHQLQNLNYANKVILMEGGRLSQEGDLNEIRARDPVLFATWQETIRVLTESEMESDTDDHFVSDTEKERVDLYQQISKIETRETKGSDGALIEEEERERGSVSWRVYLAYAKAIKYYRVILILLLSTAQAAALILSNFWLSAWSELGVDTANKTQDEFDEESSFYRRGYTILSLVFFALTVAVFTTLILSGISAAKRLHLALLRNIIHAPLRFFDTTPIGRILNRFSNDTQLIDQKLWTTWMSLLYTGFLCLSALVVNAIVTPVFMIAVVPLIVIYYIVQKYFVETSRELQRLESITRSPFLAHFSETLGGLPVIRAYRDERRFKKRLLETIDTNNVVQMYVLSSYRWLTVRLEILGGFVILLAGLGSLLSCILADLQPSLVGLAITFALSICGQLNWMVRMVAECEMAMNAVERVVHYSQIPIEEYRGVYSPPADWPNRGHIRFENVSVRYAPDLDPVLEDVSINITPGEKVGICGRTGSGKSSLTLALFRIIDTFKGRITIDGIDISHVSLLTLRSRLVIIPQDPVLFAGTIRFNLDPYCSKSDEELWEALEIAQLREVVASLDNKLDSYVSEDGDNFSVGQRQLFCLARAFLRNAKILIMDEATASVDMETDAILQNVISVAFAHRTVITIAHRIASIIDSDSVLVLSEGKVMEYGSPSTLQNQEGSAFASLLKKRL